MCGTILNYESFYLQRTFPRIFLAHQEHCLADLHLHFISFFYFQHLLKIICVSISCRISTGDSPDISIYIYIIETSMKTILKQLVFFHYRSRVYTYSFSTTDSLWHNQRRHWLQHRVCFLDEDTGCHPFHCFCPELIISDFEWHVVYDIRNMHSHEYSTSAKKI